MSNAAPDHLQVTAVLRALCGRFRRSVTMDAVEDPAKDVILSKTPVKRAGTKTPIAKDKTGDAVSLRSVTTVLPASPPAPCRPAHPAHVSRLKVSKRAG